ncbi:MAG: YifB family Mg chelatase-like AAA ATPase [Gammaproteobacteria bacterium]|nr:YifB family Mg chelatase-like AAA ATPase [Gammaproteobacteria bacterium]
MALATLYSRALVGIESPLVTVEVHLSNGLPSLSIVGLPETAVKESKDRVRSAILNSNFEFPARRLTVNLAPADLPKDGGRYDLAIALGILAASKQISLAGFENIEFIGELSLSGELRPVQGLIPTALQCQKSHRSLIVPRGNTQEASLVTSATCLAASSLADVCLHLSGQQTLETVTATDRRQLEHNHYPDLAEVKGQQQAKRALTIAAAGGHNLLMVGPPGTGKTMLASRLPGILPPMTEQEAIESATVWSISNEGVKASNWGTRPFRNPHHTASGVALVGGGSHPRPGEISMAHHGVLFLDELVEFNRDALEVLREPLETGRISIARAARQAEFPARFQLVAAMNHCPGGCDSVQTCECTAQQLNRYRNKLSAPFLDRIDLQIEVPKVDHQTLTGKNDSQQQTSVEAKKQVGLARDAQLRRSKKINAHLDSKETELYCQLNEKDLVIMEKAMDKLKLSARAYHRILRVARTIADLDAATDISTAHLAEALSYRSLDQVLSR